MTKRLFDILLSALALVLLSPLLLVVAIVIVVGARGGAFFRQTRVGKGGKPFRLLKFRTMRPGSEAMGRITVGERDPRVTRIGVFLRRTKLDELPQLWNVLVGDMSLVGPRPEVPEYVALYSGEQRRVLDVRPGITSLASIAYINENELLGRSADPKRTYVEDVLPAKLELDLKYVRDRTMGMDIGILLGTAARMLGPGRTGGPGTSG